MAVKNPQFEINIRKNTNANNPGYGKYYPKAVEKQTISLRGCAACATTWQSTTRSTAATAAEPLARVRT